MNIKKNDTVIVLSGKDKGVKGKVLVAMPAENKVIVEKVNVATCHTKPRRQGETGGIVKKETFSTMTLFSAGIATRTLPLTPLSLPDRTITVSFFLMFIPSVLH